MLYADASLYVRIQNLSRSTLPVAWMHAFSTDRAYRVLGYFAQHVHALPDVLLFNDGGYLCFVPLRHLRAVAYMRKQFSPWLPLHSVETDHALCLEEIAVQANNGNVMQLQALSLPSARAADVSGMCMNG